MKTGYTKKFDSFQALGKREIFADFEGGTITSNDDYLAKDQMLAIAVGKIYPTGMVRKSELDKGKSFVGKSTLNRMELTPADVKKNP
jgi:hypothetical protein